MRNWDTKGKALIVIEGLKGRSAAEICTSPTVIGTYSWETSHPGNLNANFKIATPLHP
jgi:hypothetical protein